MYASISLGREMRALDSLCVMVTPILLQSDAGYVTAPKQPA